MLVNESLAGAAVQPEARLGPQVHAYLQGRVAQLKRLESDGIELSDTNIRRQIADLENAVRQIPATDPGAPARSAKLFGGIEVWHSIRLDPRSLQVLMRELQAWVPRSERLHGETLTRHDFAGVFDVNTLIASHHGMTGTDRENFMHAAEAGDRDAQYVAAYLSLHGIAGESDPVRSTRWLTKAARQGHRAAQLDLANAYRNGVGVERDETAAVRWYLQAANQGDAFAQASVAHAYWTGTGVEQDPARAVAWFKIGAARHDPAALYNLGMATLHGFGIEQNHAVAIDCFRRSANAGAAAAQHMLGEAYASDDAPGIAFNAQTAAWWFRRAAIQGYAPAQYRLGSALWHGDGVAADPAQAVAWYAESANQGYALAQHDLGHAHWSGIGVARNYELAVAWYRLAAHQGLAVSQHCLGDAHWAGIGVPQSDEIATAWYREAADQGLDIAQQNLGHAYSTGRGVEQDDAAAATWFRKAAEQGQMVSQARLGVAYATGAGVPQDFDLARMWLHRAAQAGHPHAQAAIDDMAGAHHERLEKLFGAQLAQLAERYPSIAPAQSDAVDALYHRLMHDFDAASASSDAGYADDVRLAKNAVRRLCGKGEALYATQDWAEHRGQESLAYVHAYISGQTSQAARDRGMRALVEHLARAQGKDGERMRVENVEFNVGELCMTRHVEEILQSLQTAYLEQMPELFTGDALGIPLEARRAVLLETAKAALRELGPQADHAALIQAFETSAERKHFDIAKADVDAYARTYLAPEYFDTLRDSVFD